MAYPPPRRVVPKTAEQREAADSSELAQEWLRAQLWREKANELDTRLRIVLSFLSSDQRDAYLARCAIALLPIDDGAPEPEIDLHGKDDFGL